MSSMITSSDSSHLEENGHTRTSPIASLSNGTISGTSKLAIKKPPPPAQPKTSRFLKTKSLTLSSLPKLGYKSSNSVKQGKESNSKVNGSEAVSQPPPPHESVAQLRESPLWKLPGISTLKKNRRHSSAVEGVSTAMDVEPRLATTPPEVHRTLAASSHESRELPPLPTIPPLGITLPNTEATNVVLAEAAPNSTSTMSEGVNSASLSAAPNDQSGVCPSCSVESLTQSEMAFPPSSSTPKIDNRFNTNGQSEKVNTINSMIEKYNKFVPLRIRVLQGYCSDTADINISTGDIYDVHTIKTTKVVTIRDQDGMTYRVPLDSSMKFGLVFNLSSNYDEGLCGYTFKTVSDLTSLSVLPQIVCTQRAFEGSDVKSSVEENEVLVVHQALKSIFRGKRGIKVFSLQTKTEKVLPEECDVGFSTNPSLVRLHLPDIIEYVSKPFPAHAVMYPSSDNTEEDIPGTLSRVITMLDYSTKQSFMVSAVVDENDETTTDESAFFEIPLDDDMKDIEVSILKWTEPTECPKIVPATESDSLISNSSSFDGDDHVYDDTINVLQSSDTLRSLAESHRCSSDDLPSRCGPGIQTGENPPVPDKPQWLSSPKQADAPAATQLQYDSIAPSLPESNTLAVIPQASEEDDPGYDTVGLHLIRRGDNNVSDASDYNKIDYNGYNELDGGDPRILSWLEDLQSASNNIEGRLTSLEQSLSQKNELTEITWMKTVLEQLAQKIESFDSQLNSLTHPTTMDQTTGDDLSGEIESASEIERNKKYLGTLDEAKVGDLIDAMGLSQYKDKFKAERVSGEILLECNEQVLQDELDVRLKIHRIRLEKVISGIHSAKSLIEQKSD